MAPVKQRVLGAFVLGAPGTYVEERPGLLVVGNRPGALHWAIAAGVPLACLALTLALDGMWWLGAGALVLFGLPSTLVVANRQRWEARPGLLALRGRALGREVERDYPLGPGAAVRLGTRVEMDQDTPVRWTTWQAQVLTAQGWVAVAESGVEGPARAFAAQLAKAAALPLEPA